MRISLESAGGRDLARARGGGNEMTARTQAIARWTETERTRLRIDGNFRSSVSNRNSSPSTFGGVIRRRTFNRSSSGLGYATVQRFDCWPGDVREESRGAVPYSLKLLMFFSPNRASSKRSFAPSFSNSTVR